MTIDLEGFEFYQGRLFQLIGKTMGLACFKLDKSVKLDDATDFNYLKTKGRISMEYDVNTKCIILGLSLDEFLTETIELQSKH